MKKIISVFLCLVFVSVMCFGASAKEDNAPIPAKTLNAITNDFRKALKSGETSVPISKYGLYSDSSGKTYIYLFEKLFLMASDIMSYNYGKYSENIALVSIVNDNNDLMSEISIIYPDRYIDENGKCDTEKVAEDKKLVLSRYQNAKDRVKKSMTDLEKALLLYDYIVETIEYSETEDDDGNFSLYSYMVAGLLLDRRGVCSGYAKLYASLLNDVGVPAITVMSSEMNHEWVMVRIDGEWYHADPTWDDPVYDQGFTAYLDANEDNVDEGAVTHYYFLKSDEEIEELEHTNWTISNTVNPDRLSEAPKSGPSGKFDGMFFDTNNGEYYSFSAMNYINGYWYFADIRNCAVIRTTIDGEPEIVSFPVEDEIPKYCFGYNDDLYISTYKSVYRFNTFNDSFTRILEIPPEDEDVTFFSEMNISFNEMKLISVTYKENGENDYDISYKTDKYPMDELEIKEAVKNDDDDSSTASRSDDAETHKPLYTKPVNINNNPPQAENTAAVTTAVSDAASQGQNDQFNILFIIIPAGALLVIIAVVIIIVKRVKG